MKITGLFGRRSVLKAGALLGGLSAPLSRSALADAQERNDSRAREAVEENSLFSQIIHNANGSKITSPKPHEGSKVDKYASVKRALSGLTAHSPKRRIAAMPGQNAKGRCSRKGKAEPGGRPGSSQACRSAIPRASVW